MASHWHQLTVKDNPRYDADVAKLQKAINRHNRYLKIGGVRVDGRFGHETLVKARRIGWFLGAPDSQLKRGTPVSIWLQILIRAPWRIYSKYPDTRRRGIKRVRARRQQLRNWRAWGIRSLAKYCLDSPRVHFWSGLSTGSERRRFQELASSGRCWCPVTQRWVVPDVDILRFIVDVAHRGNGIMVNALTGGHHMTNSRHYYGKALDTDLSYGGSTEQVIARVHGLYRNFERSHRHYDS